MICNNIDVTKKRYKYSNILVNTNYEWEEKRSTIISFLRDVFISIYYLD